MAVGTEALRFQFRKCAVTDFAIERNGNRLCLAHGITAVVLLAIGGLMALLVAIQRVDAVQFISDDWWYRLVAAHGTIMLIFWLLFFEVAALLWGSTMLINAPLRIPRVAWASFAMMAIGVVLSIATMLAGKATVMFTAYPPLEADALFYLGVLLVAVGVLINVVIFFVNVAAAKREGYQEGSLPLVVYGLAATAIIAVYSLGTGAVAYGATFLKALGIIDSVDPAFYRMFFWGIGHGAQQVNLGAMVSVWYALIALTVGGKTISESLSRLAFLLLVAFIHLGAVHHLLVDPGLGTSHRLMNTGYLLYLAVLASLIHAFCIPSSIEVAQRARGFGKGLFQWLIRAPWKEPGFSSLVLSITFFGFIGGVTGVIMGTMQMNMLIHNTLFVPGHFHGTVVAGTTLAFMGISYYLIPLWSRRALVGAKIARLQPWVFFAGIAMLSIGMIRAGLLGAPRRAADLTYQATTFPSEGYMTGETGLSMLVVLLGALTAVVGGVMFVYVMVATLLKGEVTDRPDKDLVLAFGAQARERNNAPYWDDHKALEEDALTRPKRFRKFEAPGTVILVFGFLAWFVIMYVLAHYNISTMWPVN
jgi:cytochrome c oxidase subunit 1